MSTSTFYQDLLEKFKEHLLTGRPIDSFFIQGAQNIRDMRSTFQSLGSISKFIDWLERKAANEAAGNPQGAALFRIMGGQ